MTLDLVVVGSILSNVRDSSWSLSGLRKERVKEGRREVELCPRASFYWDG